MSKIELKWLKFRVDQKIEYILYISSITPNIGSIRGGSLVTVYGDGFSTNCSLNQINFGDQSCNIKDCSSNWIKCQTSNAYSVYKIDNSASDPCNRFIFYLINQSF